MCVSVFEKFKYDLSNDQRGREGDRTRFFESAPSSMVTW